MKSDRSALARSWRKVSPTASGGRSSVSGPRRALARARMWAGWVDLEESLAASSRGSLGSCVSSATVTRPSMACSPRLTRILSSSERSHIFRARPLMRPTEASPSHLDKSRPTTAPSANSRRRPSNIALSLSLAQFLTSRSSHVPAAFQAEAELVDRSSDSGETVSCFTGPVALGGSFVSRCLYHVIGSSSSSSSSSSCFFLATGFDGLTLFELADLLADEPHVRLWNCQSDFWHEVEQ
mmetsp:Transcript_23649/g.74008  ORF Transcript_23649/g.74008 Transcript_23649/m.74008 type:complete len:239 (-) Transcript_23649:196-912(-)